jgi:hypothetical protein
VPASKILEHAPDQVFFGNGDGGFREGPTLRDPVDDASGTGLSTCAWPIDLDADGDLDVVALRGGGPEREATRAAVVYENLASAAGITLELVPTQSSPHGLGTQVVLERGDSRLTRTVRSEANPFNSTVLPLHFGVGSGDEPLRCRVRWPSGLLQEVGGLQPGRAYRITEGSENAEPWR